MDTETWAKRINLKGNLAAVEIENSLKNVNYFSGIISLSQLENIKINYFPVSFAVNFNNHWIGFYLSDTTLEIFDSTSSIWKHPPKELIKFICLYSNKNIKINSKLQNKKSKICALYVILFIFLKGNRWEWEEIIEIFSCKSELNDSYVSMLFSCS